MAGGLRVTALSRSFGVGDALVWALTEVSMSVGPSEFVAVMGPSGSGKSTLLAICGGLEAPTSGSVEVAGHNLSELSGRDLSRLRRRHLGFVFQDFNLVAALTASENVALPLELDGVASKSARLLALKALERVDIRELSDRYPDEMSGGQRQRVAIARAIVGERGLLLADEPTGALDTATSESIVRTLRQCSDEGAAVVMVTHDPHYASMADRIVHLRDGRLDDGPLPVTPGIGRTR